MRAELVRLGHAGEAWDSLAFSLGLLPTLYVHGRALQRVAQIFAAPVFLGAAGWTKQAWVDQLPAWRAMLADWETVRRVLSGRAGFLDPMRDIGLGNPRRHPLRRFGIDVAPLVSALIVRHEYSKSSDSARLALAGRFDHLQAMLTAAAIDYRWASGAAVDAYLDWTPDSRHEFSAFPIESHRACRTVRWLSEAPQAALIARMGQANGPREFLAEMLQWERAVVPARSELAALNLESAEDVRRRTYPAALASYFGYWPAILKGLALPARLEKTGSGGGAGGGGAGVEGYVPALPTGVAPDQQPDPSTAPGRDTPGGNAVPRGGITDEEVAPVRLPLVSAGQIDAILSGQKWRAMRAAMADTVTPFDLRYLAASDAGRVARHAIGRAEAALTSTTEDLECAEDAMLVLMTLALGQPPAVLARTRVAIVQPSSSDAEAARSRRWNDAPVHSLDEALDLQIEAPVLLVWPELHPADEPPWMLEAFDHALASGEPIDGHHPRPLPSEPVAFLVPAIEPNLASSEPKEVDSSGRPRQTVRNLLIPAGVTGRLLVAHHRRSRPRPRFAGQQFEQRGSTPATLARPENKPSDAVGIRLFHSFGDATPPVVPTARPETEVTEQRITEFLNAAGGCTPPPGHDRWSVRLLQDLLPAHVEATSGDRTLAWLLSCDPTGSKQARLYYTQHSLARLSQAWMLAMRSAGLGLLAPATDCCAQPGGASHGEGNAPETCTASPETAPQLPGTWPWRTPVLAASRVGAGFVATVDEVRRLVKTLQAKVSEPVTLDRRSALRTHHRHLLLLTIVYQGLCTAMRALRSPVGLLRAVEQSDRVRAKASLAPVDEVFVGLADKESFYNQRARLVAMPPALVRQLRILQSHQIALVVRLDRYERWQSAPPGVRAMFRLDDKDVPAEVSVAWVEKELAALGFPWPANFSRAFLRTRLLERGCAAADLDALLGHRDAGGGAIGLHATFDFDNSRTRLQATLASLHADIDLKVMPSALVAGPLRLDKEVLLAPMHLAGPIGRGRSGRPRQQGRLDGLSDFWQTIHLRATDDDRRQVVVLVRLLRSWARQGNVLAGLLCAPDPSAFAAEHGLVGTLQPQPREPADPPSAPPETAASLEAASQDIVVRLTLLAENDTRARFHMAASWFRLLVRAQHMLKSRGTEVPEFPMVAIVRPASSPFVEQAALSLPIVDGWRAALLNWMQQALAEGRTWRANPLPGSGSVSQTHAGRPMPAAPSAMATEGWATALVMSAVLNGMLLDLTQLSMLLRRFSTPGGRDLPLSGPHRRAHLDFQVAAGGAMDRQTHRWWFDPLTELIWLNAPPMPRELHLGDLHSWLRRLALMAFEGSVTLPFEPHSFSDLIRCAEVWWLMRASRTVVASQRRQIDASSILTDRWARLVGARQLAAPPCLDKPDADAQPDRASASAAPSIEPGKRRRRSAITTESAFSQLALVRAAGERGLDQSSAWDPEPGDAELLASLAAAHPWIEQVARALAGISGTSPPCDLSRLRQVQRPNDAARVGTLVEFAIWLADPAAGGFTGPPLVRTFTAVAQALAMHGELAAASAPLLPETIARILMKIDDLPLSSGATPRSLRQAMRKLAQYLQIESEVLALLDADEREELEGDDHRSHADACVLSFEEYGQIQRALDDGLYPGLTRTDRILGRLLLTVCFRLALRPGEVYGIRLRDVTPEAVYVLPYGDHQLKSSNARRRVPLDLLMPNDERERLQKFVHARLARGASPDELLLAQPGTGPAKRQRVDRWVHRVMRDVTLDPGVRLYHARHSLSTWADLALRAVDHPEVLRFFEELPQTGAFLRQGDQLARALFGSPQAAVGRTSFALARLVGHVGPAVTHMHYIHGDDLVRAAVVEREARRIDKAVWMRLTGLARSTIFALLKEDGFERLMDHARRAAGWRTRAVAQVGSKPAASNDVSAARASAVPAGGLAVVDSIPGDAPAATAPGEPGLSDWIAVSRVCEISAVVASGKRTSEQAAALFGLEPQRIEALMSSLRRWLPEVAQPGKQATSDAGKGLVSLALSSATSLPIQRAEVAAHARALRDPVGLRSDLEFVIRCYDRRDRDFHVRDAESLQRLVRMALALGMEPARTMVVVRTLDPSKDEPRLPAWVRPDDLGPFAACRSRCIGVRSAAKAESYAKWLGFMPVTASQEGCSSAFATFAVLAISSLRCLHSAKSMTTLA